MPRWYCWGPGWPRAAVSPEYLATFGVTPLAGGFPDAASAEAVPVLLSHRYWRQRFGGQPDALGQKTTLRGVPCVVAGVLPPGFQGATVEYGPDVRIPQAALPQLFPTEPSRRGIHSWRRARRRRSPSWRC